MDIRADVAYANQTENGVQFSDPNIAQVQSVFNVNNLRPFIDMKTGRVYVNTMMRNKKGKIVPTVIPFVANSVVNNAVLRRDEWIEIDRAVLKIARERLVGAADLINRGLTYNLTNPMGKTVLEYQDMNDPGEAYTDMDAATQYKNDRPVYQTKYIPIPIIHSDFVISQRVLEASRTTGESIDVSMAEACTRRVAEKLEDHIFTNQTFSYGGGTMYSYVSDPNKNTTTLSVNWDASGKTGAQIKEDVLNMKKALINAKHYGPYVLYVPTDYETVLDEDYSTQYAKTIRMRLMEIDGIESIKVVDHLPDDTVVMVQMQSSTVRLINGFAPRVVQWSTQGGLMHHFKVMAIQVIQTRADQAGNSGICVLS
jgi:uncharacterized linocin/CFP29 family protein